MVDHMPLGPIDQIGPHLSHEHKRGVVQLAHLQQLPDHHHFQRRADAARHHDECVAAQHEVMQPRKKGLVLVDLADERIRLLLELFAARESAGFVKFIKTATGLFYAPFQGIVASPRTAEGFTLALPIIVAIVVYMLLHLAINGLLRMFAHRKTAI